MPYERPEDYRGDLFRPDKSESVFGGIVLLSGCVEGDDVNTHPSADDVVIGVVHDGGGYTPGAAAYISQGFMGEDECIQEAWDILVHHEFRDKPEVQAEAAKDAAEHGMDPEAYFTEAWDGYAITLTTQEFLAVLEIGGGNIEEVRKAIDIYEEDPEI